MVIPRDQAGVKVYLVLEDFYFNILIFKKLNIYIYKFLKKIYFNILVEN